MNLKLAALLESIPPEFMISFRGENIINYEHKDKKISVTWYTEPFVPMTIAFFKAGQFHRPYEEGPATIVWNGSGDVIKAGFWENGVMQDNTDNAWWQNFSLR